MPRGIPNNPATSKKRGRKASTDAAIAAKRTVKATGNVISAVVRETKKRAGNVRVEVGEILKGIVFPSATLTGRESIYKWEEFEDGDTRPIKGVTLASLKNSVSTRNSKERASGSKAHFVAVEMVHQGKKTVMLGRRDDMRRTRKPRKG